MSIVAVVGDAATTTALALAVAWPRPPSLVDQADHGSTARRDVLVVEADPSGGSMAAWLDLPGSPTLSAVVTRAADGGWPLVDRLAHDTASGLRVVPAPARSVEASRAVDEADRWLFDLLARLDHVVAIVDAGAPPAALGPPAVARSADVVVVVHRQARQSARAAAVRVERLAERVEVIAATGCAVVLAIIGRAPFEPDEIARFATDGNVVDVSSAPLVELADDPLAAAVLAGRSGVSARRLARLPLMRSAAELAAATAVVAAGARPTARRPAP